MNTLRSFLGQKNLMFKIGLFVCLLWIVVAALTPLIAPQDPLFQVPENKFQPPSSQHWFGTDKLGRDVLSRVLYGSRFSIPAGLVTVLVSFVVGILFGGLAGYIGGKVDEVMMRFSEMVQSFPPLVLAMVIAAALGPNITNSIFAMAIIWWPNYARLTRSVVLSVKENDYITAGKVMGAGHGRLLLREILPNSVGPLIIMCTLDLGNAILMFAGLSFLGLGVQPPAAEWGSMVSEGVETFNYWWVATFPGLAIFSVALAANFVGDGLRDYMDPRMRRSAAL